jgi:hypothetical protein
MDVARSGAPSPVSAKPVIRSGCRESSEVRRSWYFSQPPRVELHAQIVQKLRRWSHARDQEIISCPRTRHIKRMALGGADLFQVCIIRD